LRTKWKNNRCPGGGKGISGPGGYVIDVGVNDTIRVLLQSFQLANDLLYSATLSSRDIRHRGFHLQIPNRGAAGVVHRGHSVHGDEPAIQNGEVEKTRAVLFGSYRPRRRPDNQSSRGLLSGEYRPRRPGAQSRSSLYSPHQLGIRDPQIRPAARMCSTQRDRKSRQRAMHAVSHPARIGFGARKASRQKIADA